MRILENEDLKKYSSIKIGGVAKYLCEIENEQDIKEFLDFANKEKLPSVILGSGSNTFFNDGLLKKVFGLIKIKGKFKSYDGPDFVNIEIYRNALEWFQPALEMHIDDKIVNEKINFCHTQLKYERKVKSILALIAAVVIAVVFLV